MACRHVSQSYSLFYPQKLCITRLSTPFLTGHQRTINLLFFKQFSRKHWAYGLHESIPMLSLVLSTDSVSNIFTHKSKCLIYGVIFKQSKGTTRLITAIAMCPNVIQDLIHRICVKLRIKAKSKDGFDEILTSFTHMSLFTSHHTKFSQQFTAKG